MTRTNMMLALCLGTLAAIGPLSMDMYLSAMPSMADAFGVGHGRIELTITMFFIGFAVGQLTLGPLSDKLGRKPVALGGLMVFALACFGCAYAGTFEEMLAWRLVQGLGGSVCMVISMSAVRDRVTGREAERMMGVVVGVLGIAPVIAPLLGSVVLEVTGWRTIFLLLGAVAILVAAFLKMKMPETLLPQRRNSRSPAEVLRSYIGLFGDRTFVPYAAALALTQGSLYAYLAVASPILISGYGLGTMHFGIIFGVNALGLVVTAQLGPFFSGLLGTTRFARLILLVRAALALAFLGLHLAGALSLPVLLPLLFLMIASLGFAMPVLTNMALAEQGRAAGTAAALMGGLGFGTGALISSSTGLIADGTAGPLALANAVTAVTAAVIGLAFFASSPASVQNAHSAPDAP